MFIDDFNLKTDIRNEHAQTYNNIATRAQTPNPCPRPEKGPDIAVCKKEKEEKQKENY